MKWYRGNIPELNEPVMCTVRDFNQETGFIVTLDEYDEAEGLLMLKDLQNKKIRGNAANFLKRGQQLPLLVTGVDDSTLTLSKKDISEENAKKCTEYYTYTQKLYMLARRLSHISSFTEEQWGEQFKDLLQVYLENHDKGDSMESHPFNMCVNKEALHRLELPTDFQRIVEERHVDLFGVQIHTAKRTFTIQSYGIDGMEKVKHVLLKAAEPYKTEKPYTNQELHEDQTRCNVALLPVAIPRFELHVQSYLVSRGEAIADEVLLAISQSGLDYFKRD